MTSVIWTAPSKQMVEKWFADFERGQNNIKEVHIMVLADRKLKLNEIADTLRGYSTRDGPKIDFY